jgi:hypothetical protein
MAEVMAAFAVLSVVSAVMIQLVVSMRGVTRTSAETRLAGDIAQGVLERVRSMPRSQLADDGAMALALPRIATRLQDARLTVAVAAWNGNPSLRHVRVVLNWRSRSDREHSITREALIRHAAVQ